jgi:chemotaxis protein methyltransferase CheR
VNYEEFKNKLLNLSNINLDYYQSTVVKRRLENFMRKHKKDSFASLLDLLKHEPEHIQKLTDFVAINITEFFRNPDKFKTLQEQILPEIFSNTKEARIWSAACSSGEEPYSIAIVIKEEFPDEKAVIHATDIDKKALTVAEKGVYHLNNLKHFGKKKIELFFENEGENYLIRQDIKIMVKYKFKKLYSSPFPVSKYHLISCRNALIHFDNKVKSEIFKNFNTALIRGGYLFVGSSELIISPEEIGFKRVEKSFYQKM